MSQSGTLIVGLGSPFGDDQAGLVVAQHLRAACPGLEIRAARSPSELLGQFEGANCLHIIDACRGAGGAGTIARWEWPDAALAHLDFTGTHDLSLAAALQLAAACGGLPPRVVIWGIEAEAPCQADGFMALLSPAVAAAVEALVDRLLEELSLPEAAHA
jgi:hydrogenase maturation protease